MYLKTVVSKCLERSGREIHFIYISAADVSAETECLLAYIFHELGTGHGFGITGEVFHIGGDGELASGLVSFEQQGRYVGSGSIDGGCIACGA